jgi:hypothetical protein
MGEWWYNSTILDLGSVLGVSDQLCPRATVLCAKALGTPCTGGWVGPTAGLGAVE